MFWLVRVYIDDGEHYNCVANAGSEAQAEFFARKHYQREGEVVELCEAEMFNDYEHGDPEDYTIVERN